MNKIFRILTFSLLCIFALQPLRAQETPPFYSDIQSFKKQDSLHFPPNNAILFVGSSSFTKWVDVQDYFPGLYNYQPWFRRLFFAGCYPVCS